MINQEIRQKIKKIKIHTKRIMQNTLTGDYLSAFKGSGLEFDQIREYQMGDDVRAIDWNSSTKINKIMVKQFIEERDRTVILAIDVSGSTYFSSQKELRQEYIAQLAGTLAFIASANKDKVGALFFSDVIEAWIPPSRGNTHIGKIIETIFSIKPKKRGTNIADALRFLIGLKKRNAVVFMLSDWIEQSYDYTKLLKVAGCEYDFVGVRMIDATEQQMPDIGIFDLQDSETGATLTIDTRGALLRSPSYEGQAGGFPLRPGGYGGQDEGQAAKATNPLNLFLHTRLAEQKKQFEKYKIDLLDLVVDRPFINPLIQFFHQRIRRQIR